MNWDLPPHGNIVNCNCTFNSSLMIVFNVIIIFKLYIYYVGNTLVRWQAYLRDPLDPLTLTLALTQTLTEKQGMLKFNN